MVLEYTAERSAKLLSLLRREMGLSSTLVSRLKWKNALFVNDLPAHTDCPVKPGDRIRVELAERAEGFEAEPMPLSVLYEDEAMIAVDKPAGMLVHPSPARNSGTLANGLLDYYRKTGQAAAIHPVTRLDRDTLGVVLLAKNAHVHAKLCALLKNGALEKTYRACVFGVPPTENGSIELPIARVGEGSLLRRVSEDGQRAKTDYRVLKVFDTFSLLELHPRTGRTHQLRVHCAAAGFPILGDPQYGSAGSAALSGRLGLNTQQLCAVRLRFPHPLSEEAIEITSEQKVYGED